MTILIVMVIGIMVGIDNGGMNTVKNYMPKNQIILEYEI
jgi:hypothetical protein